MIDLVDRAVAAHGGLARFNRFKTVSAHLAIGGALWLLKGQAGALSKVYVTVELHQEYASFAPFKLPNQRAVFTPQRVAVETNGGAVVAERANPRAAFAGHVRETPCPLVSQKKVRYTFWQTLQKEISGFAGKQSRAVARCHMLRFSPAPNWRGVI